MFNSLLAKLAAITASIAIAGTIYGVIPNSDSLGPRQYVEPPTVAQLLEKEQNPVLKRILTNLARCESSMDPHVINPIDRDGTPSLGLFQYKPSTLYAVIKKYDASADIEPEEIMNVIYDPVIQIKATSAWVAENYKQRSFWQNQFPDCGNRYKFWEY